jgi:hypothetical protein
MIHLQAIHRRSLRRGQVYVAVVVYYNANVLCQLRFVHNTDHSYNPVRVLFLLIRVRHLNLGSVPVS